MKRVLIAYATHTGSTADVATAIARELASPAVQVEVQPLAAVASIDEYDAVVVGGPMILGWHRQARAFLRRHRKSLGRIPFAVFVMAMSLTETGERDVAGATVVVDDRLPMPPHREGSLSFKERYARLPNYLRPILRSVRPARPRSIGVFGGRLEYGRLKWYAVLFVMVVLKVPAGDRRNWEAIRSWGRSLRTPLELG
jgi:menaquinone-dependent protoporphyrinogen IX oxidase